MKHQNTLFEGALLDEIVATTSYARRYAMWLVRCPFSAPHGDRRSSLTWHGGVVCSLGTGVLPVVGTASISPNYPFCPSALPPGENSLLHSLEPEEWEQVLRACHAPKETGVIANRAAARNRTILWILFETGMHVTEVCLSGICKLETYQAIAFQGVGRRSSARTSRHPQQDGSTAIDDLKPLLLVRSTGEKENNGV